MISWIAANHYQEVNIANLMQGQTPIFEEVDQVFVSDAYGILEDAESVF